MNSGLHVTRIWSDDDMVELHIEVADEMSRFANRVYVGFSNLTDVIDSLEAFKTSVHGGVLDVCLGKFGCEYANGAFQARLHFQKPGRLFVTCQQESEFKEFGKKTVASCATMYFCSEPALLDRFIDEFRQLTTKADGEARLGAV